MGRVNRLMERRALRRAADLALLTSLGNASPGQPGGPPDRDFHYTRSDRPDTGPPADHEPITAPIPVADVEDHAPHKPDGYDWDHEPLAQRATVAPEPVDVYELVPDRPDDRWDDGPPAENVEVPVVDLPLPDLWPTTRWYRTKPALAVLAAAVVLAVTSGGWLVLRSPDTTAELSSVQAPTSVPPAPSSLRPTAVSAPQPSPAPAPPPPPPPPPPTAEPTYSAPQWQYSEPRRSTSTPAQKPQTEVTRAPISVAPVPRPVLGSNSSTPGDAPGEKPRRHGCFGFC